MLERVAARESSEILSREQTFGSLNSQRTSSE